MKMMCVHNTTVTESRKSSEEIHDSCDVVSILFRRCRRLAHPTSVRLLRQRRSNVQSSDPMLRNKFHSLLGRKDIPHSVRCENQYGVLGRRVPSRDHARRLGNSGHTLPVGVQVPEATRHVDCPPGLVWCVHTAAAFSGHNLRARSFNSRPFLRKIKFVVSCKACCHPRSRLSGPNTATNDSAGIPNVRQEQLLMYQHRDGCRRPTGSTVNSRKVR
mmetsp:Transcript_43452/g.114560  ORF Transcript_43452/g.114560 Transcript_43452/m.114560 type:complete len:216 (-) Transcript_43452:1083-1730(-)